MTEEAAPTRGLFLTFNMFVVTALAGIYDDETLTVTAPDRHGRYEFTARILAANAKTVLSRRLITVTEIPRHRGMDR